MVDDDAQPKPKTIERPVRPRPVTKKSQHQAKVPNVAEQRDLTTNKAIDKGTSIQKSRKLLFFFAIVVHELVVV
jgi:hypothetical protein